MKTNQIKIKKKKFPIGIFLLLWFILALIVTGGTGAYYYVSVKNRITDFEKYSRKYSITLANAFAEVAELSYQVKNYKKIKQLFASQIKNNTIDMAFFVLKSGELVAHSDKKEWKSLKGNIFNKEFEYNADLILNPALKKRKKVQFTYYNIINKKVPRLPVPVLTYREQKMYIKKYFYKDYDRVGWLATKAVFYKKKAVGTVNFIISKDKIYSFMLARFNECAKLLLYLNSGAFGLAFMISLIILIRYRGIQNGIIRLSQRASGTPSVAAVVQPRYEEPVKKQVRSERSQPAGSDEFISVELFDEEKVQQGSQLYRKRKKIIIPVIYEEDIIIDEESEILDSIQANKKG